MARANNILVAIDGSDNALRALKFAASQVRSGGRLHLIYAQAPVPRSRAVSQALIDEHYARQKALALNKAKAYLARAKIDAEIAVEIGDPAPTIVDYARKKKCTQIVMGNHGHGAIKGLFLGSVAMKVVQLADVPVTLVK
ncbi:MAG: universal stress protein [Xanthomonadaceae bacterium]|nr:universal stress protein [Xanthomonadaceae bacterium]